MLQNPQIKIKHCFCWANHNWTRSWLGEKAKVLLKQEYNGKTDYKNHFYEMINALTDERYLKIDDCPLIGIFNSQFQDFPLFIDTWRELAYKEGIGELKFFTLIRKLSDELEGFYKSDIDYFTIHNPSNDWNRIQHSLKFRIKRKLMRWTEQSCTIYDYKDYVAASCNNLDPKEFPCVVANWDRTPRAQSRGEVFVNFTPDLFGKLLDKSNKLIMNNSPGEQIIFIKSWNEWAEGNILEPDQIYGRSILDQFTKLE